VTITLPEEVVRSIDVLENNRSRFILDAVRRELNRRKRRELRRSLSNPHPESRQLAAEGLEEWGRGLPREEAAELVDWSAGSAVNWKPNLGWRAGRK
jgi:hypothetical protein